MALLLVVPVIALIAIAYKTVWNNDLTYLWVNALEMGFYEQGRGVLHSSDHKYCCLGVLCNILQSKGMGEWVKRKENYAYYSNPVESGIAFLPLNIKVKIDLKDARTLMELNDGDSDTRQHSFKEIAQYIKENVKIKNIL